MKNAGSPPRLALRWLERFSGWEDDYGAAGDFEEFYRAQVEAHGIRRARRACWRQVLAAFPGYVKNVFVWSDAMLKSYLKIAVRNLWKHKGYSFINIAGLAAGMACALFILLWVQNELSYDRFHADAGTLFRLEQNADKGLGGFRHSSMPYPLGPILKAEIPEVREAVRIAGSGSFLVRSGEKAFFESNIPAVDPQFLRMFAFPLIKGDPATALDRPGSVVMTEDMAEKYFDGADPLGQTVIFNDKHPFTVTGVLKNIPQNSSLTFDMLVPFDFTRTLGRYSDSLTSNDIETYVRLGAMSDRTAVGAKITRLIKDKILAESRTDPGLSKMLAGSPELGRRFEAYQKSRVFLLMPLVDIHLLGGRMAIKNVYLYSALAFFVLLIAGINFMNLATARSAGRAKEIGLRKVVGARRKSLIGQFYGESVLTASLAGVVALLLVVLLFPAFRALSGKAIAWSTLGSGKFLIGTLIVVLFTGLIAGSYPALFLSSFPPIKAIQGRAGRGAGGALFRKTLVFLQFSLSVLLLIGMGVVSRQVDFMRAKKLGYDKEQLIYLPMRDQAPVSYAAFKEQLRQNPRILGVTATRHPPTAIQASDTYAEWDGQDPGLRFKISFASVDFDFPETMAIADRRGTAILPGRSLGRPAGLPGQPGGSQADGIERRRGRGAAVRLSRLRRHDRRRHEGLPLSIGPQRARAPGRSRRSEGIPLRRRPPHGGRDSSLLGRCPEDLAAGLSPIPLRGPFLRRGLRPDVSRG